MDKEERNHLEEDQVENQAIIDYLCSKTWANRQVDDDCPLNSPHIPEEEKVNSEMFICKSPPYVNLPVCREDK